MRGVVVLESALEREYVVAQRDVVSFGIELDRSVVQERILWGIKRARIPPVDIGRPCPIGGKYLEGGEHGQLLVVELVSNGCRTADDFLLTPAPPILCVR